MSACKVRDAFIPGLILAFAAVAAAQNDDNRNDAPRTPHYSDGGSALIFLLTKPGVQKELGLDESGSQELLESLREIDPTHSAFRTPEERQQGRAIRGETMQKSEAAVRKALSEEQFRRFQQLEAQYMGGRALLSPKTAEQFALTAEQQERLEPIKRKFVLSGQAGAPRLSDEEASVRSERYKADLLAVLTPEQTNQWKAMTGAPFTTPKSFSGPSFRLVLLPEVQRELGLSEDDAATLMQSLAAIQKEGYRRIPRPNRAGLPVGDGIRQSNQIIDTVRLSLTVSQWNRLQELILQHRGVESLAHHEVAKKLALSEEQRERVREAINENRRGRFVSVGEIRTRRQKEETDLLDILTDNQKEQWTAMQGAKVAVQLLLSPRISPAGE